MRLIIWVERTVKEHKEALLHWELMVSQSTFITLASNRELLLK
jgi:hypothetical protein